jgi:hypothetical protein
LNYFEKFLKFEYREVFKKKKLIKQLLKERLETEVARSMLSNRRNSEFQQDEEVKFDELQSGTCPSMM